MNLPDLKPPKMPPEEHLRRLHLQKQGLASWEDGPSKEYMTIWLEARIVEMNEVVKLKRKERS